jgi:multiple sugar transport system permease protein
MHEAIAGYLFVLPAFVLLLIFTVLPIIATLGLSVTDYQLLSPLQFTGMENWQRLAGDTRAWTTFRNSLLITIGAVFFNNLFGFALAVGVNRAMPRGLKTALRTTYFFPFITTAASLAMVWQFMLTKDRGMVNWMLGQVGIAPIGWLSDPNVVIWSVVMFDVWKSCGYLMVLYLAGLQSIPDSLYEAAMIDGADGLRQMRHITLPLITPTAFFCLIISSIGAFQIFDNAYVLTNGGPGDASRTIVMYIYEVAFNRFEYGYAATVSVTLMIMLLIFTRIQFWISDRWVNYE